MTPPSAPADEIGMWLTQEVWPAVDEYIERSVQSHRYHDRLWYQVETGGKRLRRGLCCLLGIILILGCEYDMVDGRYPVRFRVKVSNRCTDSTSR